MFKIEKVPETELTSIFNSHCPDPKHVVLKDIYPILNKKVSNKAKKKKRTPSHSKRVANFMDTHSVPKICNTFALCLHTRKL